jgi:hypothetical protein
VCKGYQLAVEEPGGLGRLRAAGVVGTIDTLKILTKKCYGGALRHLGFNGSNGSSGGCTRR